jgi:phosphohistidine phosphatase SixA
VIPKAPTTSTSSSKEDDSKQQCVRRLILLRHADSEVSSKVRDYDRPISTNGMREAASIAQKLQDLGWLPDLVLASNSKRTKQTLDHMSKLWQELGEVDSHFLGSLYTVAALDGQTRSHLEKCIQDFVEQQEEVQTVMCVGHNKGWEEAATSFAQQAVRLRTASAALLESVGGSWQDVLGEEAEWQLVQVVTP